MERPGTTPSATVLAVQFAAPTLALDKGRIASMYPRFDLEESGASQSTRALLHRSGRRKRCTDRVLSGAFASPVQQVSQGALEFDLLLSPTHLLLLRLKQSLDAPILCTSRNRG